MIAALPPLKSDEPLPYRLQLLRQIADTLGVGVNEFCEGAARHLFHTAEDGTRWFLVSGPNGRPVVRQVGVAANCGSTADEPIDQFTANNIQTPQGQSLKKLIDRLLLTCLR